MPTYDYECLACGHSFELFQKMTDKPIKTCPKCKKNKAKRLIGSGMGIIFKGSGFYETDYKRKTDSARQSESVEKSTTECKNKTDTRKSVEQKSSNGKGKKTENSSNDLGKEKK